VSVAYIGIGANLGDPQAQVEAAFGEIGLVAGTKVTARSPLYRTAPIGYAAQPDYVNAVARIETGLAPAPLLAELQEIENRHGRERPFRDAPRTLDLDLLLYDALRIATPALTVPHPQMHRRAFVLAPLLDLDPAAEIPGLGPAREWLARCTDQRIARTA